MTILRFILLSFLALAFSGIATPTAPVRAGLLIYLTPEKLVYPFPLDGEIQIMGYLREVAAGTPVDIEVSLELPDGTMTYLDPALEFHPLQTDLLYQFPFVAVPTAELFPLDGSMVFESGAADPETEAGGEGTAIGDLPAGRYVLRAQLSGGATDSSEVAFFIVAEELLPSIAETPRPIIDGLDPPYGRPGSEITIHGRNLRGDPDLVDPALVDQFQIKVSLSGQEMPMVEMGESDEWLKIRLLSGAVSGDLLVYVTLPYWDETATDEHLIIPRVAVYPSNAFPFYVAPVITGLDRATLRPGDTFSLLGYNFNPDPAADQVLFDNIPGTVTEATETSLTVTAPTLSTDQPVSVVVVSNSLTSDPFPIYLTRPIITNWYPHTLVPGRTLTINGTGFSAAVENNRVLLGGIPLPIKTASETELVVDTGAGLLPGSWPLEVEVWSVGSSTPAWVMVVPVW